MKMQILKAIAAVLASAASSAYAHVQEGRHVGTTADGAACEMRAGTVYFENDRPHPLNERIRIAVGDVEFTVGHPPVIDAATATAFFNHDLFQGVIATPTGAKALVVAMVHEEGHEGPVRFTLIENEWRTGKKTSLVCDGLRFAN